VTIDVSRRIFLETLAGTGLTLAIAGCGRIPKAAPTAAHEVNAWLSIAPDEVTTIRVNATEMGQGAQTGLAQIVADELDADWSKVRVEMAPVTRRYFVKDGDYFTGGSSSIGGELNQFDAFAKAGAMARAMLVSAAARRWRVGGADCTAENGIVSGPRGERASYGQLVADALKEPVPVSVTLKDPAARRLIGKPVARLDIPEKVNGTSIYGIDVKLPGMLYAAIRHCPYQQGTLVQVDDTPARARRGVKHVVRLDGAVAVVADRWWRARLAVEALDPVWRKPPGGVVSDEALSLLMKSEIGAKHSLLATLTPNDPHKEAVAARVDAAFAGASDVFERAYQVPFLSHSPIEPLNATARVTSDGCELWASMQNQSGMQKDVANALGIAPENVVLHTTRVGGGFGRRLERDYGIEAALIAKATGAPVKLIWTREEDMTHDFYRPASSCRLKVALSDGLSFRAFDYSGATVNDTAIGGIARNYGPVADTIVRQKTVKVPMTIGAWRSVDPSITIFFVESLVDEIAHDRKRDPLEYRRLLLADNPRGLRVLNAVARMAQWGSIKPGRAQGVAFFNHAYWGTAVAEIVELSVGTQNKLTIHKVYCAIDPGTAVNPNAVEAQAQGGITLGLSAALAEAITLKDGRVEQANFDQYSILRMAGAPDVEVKILESADAAIGGCGEPPVPPSMPALTNAVFAATGVRVRALPLSKSGFTI
jgi:isoquinoline 1-oxidoreductase beta subunit